MARGSSSRSKKKKGSSSSKPNKSPALGAQTVIYPHLEGGNPFEPGTKNYEKLLDIRRRLYEVSSKRPCGFTISACDPFAPGNFRGASKFTALVPDKTLFPGPRLKESKIACPPSQDGCRSVESRIVTSPPQDGCRSAESRIVTLPPRDGCRSVESRIATLPSRDDCEKGTGDLLYHIDRVCF
ncbi:uncharacterized protein LOC133735573 [Rosa rugosa]|uniref:uncharacterized protein LOC133735573 n=1 Tax=Rosa rugosa TaxID=74645 RepID=UPI002B40C189|nr:uncharacterized protein LOC133735573 [Rosa rugosa]